MTMVELQKVKDFTITNKFGKIEFLGETDISGVNLADIVTIEKQSVEVYDRERHIPYPKVGEKLNKNAIITLNGIVRPTDMTLPEFIQALEDSAADQDVRYDIFYLKQGSHMIYDEKKSEWKFMVKHFTKYGLILKKKSAQVDQAQPAELGA